MKHFGYLVVIISTLASCGNLSNDTPVDEKYQNLETPNHIPLKFRPDLTPNDHLVHRGIFSPDFKQFYYTLSNKEFSEFTVKVIHQLDGQWSKPEDAFFNSPYNEHGMSFSPDGNSIYFSSTRPVENVEVENTWHLWKSTKVNGKWEEPIFIDIANLRNKLLSHPTVTKSGRIYYHASNIDYSDMNLYYSDPVNGKFSDAKPVLFPQTLSSNKCTPFVSPDEDYLIYAHIDQQLQLMISYKDTSGKWDIPRPLNDLINNDGQGNPFVTIDGEYLIFATGDQSLNNWSLKWVKMAGIENDGGQ